jgi:glycosyltransferase involved in cell wall biosynthesis
MNIDDVSPDRVVVINDISQPMGGATAVALESIRLMRARGIAVTLITGDSGDNPALVALGVEIVALGELRLRTATSARAFLFGLYNRGARDMVARWISEHDTPATIYHLHGWAQILSPAMFEALEPVRSRLVLSAHDFFLVCPNGSFSFLKTGDICEYVPLGLRCIAASCDRRNYAEKMWRVARQFIQRHFYDPARSPPVLAPHAAMEPFLRRGGIPGSAISTLPNPVSAFCSTRIVAEHNHEILFVGRLEATKGPDLALAAAREAGVTIRLVGDGAMRAELETKYPEMIFLGALPHAAVAEHAARTRLLVMPSRYPEPYGLVAVEAMWSGLPVILQRTASLAPEIVAAGAGIACDPNDIAEFAKQISMLKNDDQRIAAMSANAFLQTRQLGLSSDSWSDRLFEIYCQRLLDGEAAGDLAKIDVVRA